MSSYRFIHIFTCALLFFSSPTVKAQQEPTYLYSICPNTTTFTRGGAYESSLNALLSSLSASSSYGAGFQNTTSGSSPAVVYGLFLCRGDSATDVCRDCVVFASKDILRWCPIEKSAIVWYDECMLRYSDANFFGLGQTRPEAFMYNTQNTSDNHVDFGAIGLIYSLIDKAQRSKKLYAVDKSNAPAFQTRYGMVQCTRDIDANACGSCLNTLTKEADSCCTGQIGWRVISASCMVRLERYLFFNETPVSTAPKAPTPAAVPHETPKAPAPAAVPHETSAINREARRPKVWIVVLAVLLSTAGVAFLVGFCYYLSSCKRRARNDAKSSEEILLESFESQNQGPLLDGGIITGDHDDEQQMHYLSFGVIAAATNGFSDDNKLGEGGFGPVYKGKLPNGMDVAIKRLSKKSTQGITEFKNEVILIIKLQHRNLVRLLGYCVEEDEMLLVYEYMPNKSLDAFLFDPLKCKQLDWEKRMKIIHGAAKGLQYLHEDSRLKIIHRDLKASNILLDNEMNPKISDFGTARIFGCKQMEDSTERIVGTFGYMSPEYALGGMISEKSDIYSFGVLLLEIISGKKATRFTRGNQQLSLIVYAWESWCETKGLNLVDEALDGSYSPSEAMRCVHIALLCVQDHVMDRPTISQIIHLLNSDKEPPHPKQPTFTFVKTLNSDHQSSSGSAYSVYEATNTTLEGR